MKKLILMAIALSLLAITTSSVLGATIRIDPALPAMVGTTGDFKVSVTSPSDDPTTDPHIFLVMTDACHAGLTDGVTVKWGITTITITGWHEETEHTEGIKAPYNITTGDPLTTEGNGYTVASLMDHLGTTEHIWWAFEPFLGGDITQTPADFTVNLPSDNPRMLVYALGKTSGGGSDLFNNRVPPTQPGFMILEPATIVAVTTSLIALVAYAAYRRKR